MVFRVVARVEKVGGVEALVVALNVVMTERVEVLHVVLDVVVAEGLKVLEEKIVSKEIPKYLKGMKMLKENNSSSGTVHKNSSTLSTIQPLEKTASMTTFTF